MTAANPVMPKGVEHDELTKTLLKALVREFMADEDFLQFVRDNLKVLVLEAALTAAKMTQNEIARNLILALEERGCAPRIKDGVPVLSKEAGDLQAALDVYRPAVLRVMKIMQAEGLEDNEGGRASVKQLARYKGK